MKKMSTDLVVVGAGPAGIEAAVAASQNGLKVVLLDSYSLPGGQYYKQLPREFKSELATDLEQEGAEHISKIDSDQVAYYSDTLVWGAFPSDDSDGWLLGVYGPDAPRQIETKAVILASGAYDTPVPFPGWTLPGVMTAGAGQIMVKNQRVSPGQRVVVTGSGPLHLALAAYLVHAGVKVVGFYHTPLSIGKMIQHIPSAWGQWERMKEGFSYWRTLSKAGVPVKIGWGVVKALGENAVEEAIVGRLDSDWNVIAGTEKQLNVDAVIVWNGLLCNNGLSRMVGCQHRIDPRMGGVIPVRDETMQTTCENFYVVGDAAMIGGVGLAKAEGRIAGLSAAWRAGLLTDAEKKKQAASLAPVIRRERRFAQMFGDLFAPRVGLQNLPDENTVICRCEEITLGDIREAIHRGARSVNEVKMLTRSGMGNCQGRICEMRVAQTILALSGDPDLSLENVGSYTTRPPLHPLPVSVLAEAAVDDLVSES
jgi:D-hydroxyproline dehydrogenase subunit alpha